MNMRDPEPCVVLHASMGLSVSSLMFSERKSDAGEGRARTSVRARG